MEIIFTEHAEERIKKRKITKEEILEAIKYPDNLRKEENKYYLQKNLVRAKIEIVYEKSDNYINIITIYYI
jgi:hypothetical protein